jgi:cob(I)alamin adenosyltransferase
MSIITKTGDQGMTGLMYNKRVAKTDPKVEAYGAVDELNAAIGMARATGNHPFVLDPLLQVQKDLVVIMGELATAKEDLARYQKDGFSLVTAELKTKLEDVAKEIESQRISFNGWATPGATLNSAALDLARTTCRGAERRVCALLESGETENHEIMIYLNRLSDVLWLLARWVEAREDQGNLPAPLC